MGNLPLPLTAFVAGIFSFLSPCVLPLVPGYISLISGSSVEQLRARKESGGVLASVMLHSLFFIAGFSIVFISLGAAASGVGHLMHTYRRALMYVAGALIIVFGLHLTGIIRIKALYADTRLHSVGEGKTVWGAFLIGFAFAFGWTPCIGPILATILTIAAGQGTVAKGVLLLTIYSLGLAVPFLLTSLLIDRFLVFYGKFSRHLHTVEVFSGVLLIVIGLLIFTRHFTILSGYLGFLNRFSL